MKYEPPESRSEEEIIETLSLTDNSAEERIKAVLSAIYYGRTIEFSGDTLIGEFSRAKHAEKRWLKNLFETFYGMCRTNYRLEDSIALLEAYRREAPKCRPEIDSALESLDEYKVIFKDTYQGN
ncbi:hypothetical protein HGP16_22990 [Rhizobium sp. P40RR-XXII]|uniref:hypothetical protein n=1 Tax=unclassified Rhizobium TaxID=2613769 RepID=UPI0014570FA2|nr:MULTISPECIES: hypothetical protein [unclassified Rhizobium]NLR85811.1 hypothetical protein [Rhizobium sp. P28RR-XV]NLS19409.1 hypothetical protein [Rhizobium sp. P40RR-XXII]